MTEVNKAQIAFIKDCLNLMNEGNWESLKQMGLSTIERLEKQTRQTDLYFSFPSDAEITKHVSCHLIPPYSKTENIYDTYFVKGAIWMRECIDSILKNEVPKNNQP